MKGQYQNFNFKDELTISLMIGASRFYYFYNILFGEDCIDTVINSASLDLIKKCSNTKIHSPHRSECQIKKNSKKKFLILLIFTYNLPKPQKVPLFPQPITFSFCKY